MRGNQSRDFGTIDTKWRLQVARWIRLHEPEVSSGSGFGITGKDGTLHAWYGIGQSLVLLPVDAAMTATVSPYLDRKELSSEKREQVIELLIAFIMQFVITSFILILAYKVLLSFGFTPAASAAGALAFLFGTTCLAYVQSAQENELLLALDLSALWAVRQWRSAGGWWAALAGAACGFAIITRLPSVVDALVFALLALYSGRSWRRFLVGYLPPVVAALAFDRWYQWMRFGELWSTYITIWGRQARPTGTPAGFPFSFPFWKGLLGTLFSLDKSIFLFDPLLVVLIVVAGWRRGKLGRGLRITLLCLVALLACYTALYAKYVDFGGDVAWGHRFVVVPVQLLALFAVPLLLMRGKDLPPVGRKTAWALVPVSVALQLASTAIAPNLDVIQRDIGRGHSVIWNRAVNLEELASGKAAGARYRGVPPEWRSLYYFPFQLRFRYPELAVWAIAGWLGLVFCLPLLAGFILWSATKASPVRHGY